MPTEKYMIFADINTNEENIVDMDKGEPLTINQICKLLNNLNEENQLLKNKLHKIDDILPLWLSCSEISEFRGKTVKEDIALMKCWNKKYEKYKR